MHIREVVSKNYSPQGNFIKVWNTRGWKPSVFWIFIKLLIILLMTDRLMCIICFIKWFKKSERSLVKTNARSCHSSITHRIYMTIFINKNRTDKVLSKHIQTTSIIPKNFNLFSAFSPVSTYCYYKILWWNILTFWPSLELYINVYLVPGNIGIILCWYFESYCYDQTETMETLMLKLALVMLFITK